MSQASLPGGGCPIHGYTWWRPRKPTIDSSERDRHPGAEALGDAPHRAGPARAHDREDAGDHDAALREAAEVERVHVEGAPGGRRVAWRARTGSTRRRARRARRRRSRPAGEARAGSRDRRSAALTAGPLAAGNGRSSRGASDPRAGCAGSSACAARRRGSGCRGSRRCGRARSTSGKTPAKGPFCGLAIETGPSPMPAARGR